MDKIYATRIFAASAMTFVVSGILLVFGAMTMFFGSEVESDLWPVTKDFKLGAVTVDGDDIVIVGTAKTSRSCKYIPPPVWVSETGFVGAVRALTPHPSLSYPPLDTPIPRGPWVVAGGRGHVITIKQRHECHPLWDTWSEIITIDARGL